MVEATSSELLSRAVAQTRATPEHGPSDALGGAELRHELRNALTPAAGYLQLVLRRLPEWASERDRDALLAIRESLTRALNLLEPARPGFQPTGCDLQGMLLRVVQQVPPERRGDVVLRLPAGKPLVARCSAERLAEVVANLLDNAAKYSHPGTPIEVELSTVGDWARIVVRDSGIGIEPDDLEAVFAGYRTAPARRMAPGSGIGLQLSRRLVEAEGGRLRATSVPGEGSAFYVELPLAGSSPGGC